MRVVLDTNVLIDALTDEFNVQSQLIETVVNGEITAVYTAAVKREYERIRDRLTRVEAGRQRVNEFLAACVNGPTGQVPVRLDDKEDRKFIAAATGSAADAIVTNDRHLLQVGEIGPIKIMTPAECWHRFEDEQRGTSGVWHEWMKKMSNQ